MYAFISLKGNLLIDERIFTFPFSFLEGDKNRKEIKFECLFFLKKKENHDRSKQMTLRLIFDHLLQWFSLFFKEKIDPYELSLCFSFFYYWWPLQEIIMAINRKKKTKERDGSIESIQHRSSYFFFFSCCWRHMPVLQDPTTIKWKKKWRIECFLFPFVSLIKKRNRNSIFDWISWERSWFRLLLFFYERDYERKRSHRLQLKKKRKRKAIKHLWSDKREKE